MSFEAECNSELTVIVPAYQLHFRCPVQNKIHKQKMFSDIRTGMLGSIAGPCVFLPARSDEFQKVQLAWVEFELKKLVRKYKISKYFHFWVKTTAVDSLIRYISFFLIKQILCSLVLLKSAVNVKSLWSEILHLMIRFLFVCLFDATFNNISVISWQSVLLVEETGGPGENHRPVASLWQTLLHNVVHLALIEIRTHNISGDMHWLHR